MSTMGRGLRAVLGLVLCCAATVVYLWLMVAHTAAILTIALPPALLSIGMAYGCTFVYGFYRYY